MFKKLKILLCVLLCICFSAAVLCGCGGGKEPGGTPDDTTQGDTSQTDPSGGDNSGGDEKDPDDGKPQISEEWKEDGALKILAIGNSYSDDCMEYVYRIAKSAGIEEVKVANLYIGGCSIDMHVNNSKSNAPAYIYRVNMSGSWISTNNYKLGDAIKSDDWDFITMQQASTYSGLEASYGKLGTLIDYVRSLAGEKTKFAWHMTWAYQDEFDNAAFIPYDYSQTKMYRAITSTVQKVIVPNENFTALIPSGTAVQNARTSYLGDNLNRDGTHLSYDFGRFIAGLTVFNALTGISLDQVTYAPPAVSDAKYGKALCVESAANAIKTPFDVTFSAYTERE